MEDERRAKILAAKKLLEKKKKKKVQPSSGGAKPGSGVADGGSESMSASAGAGGNESDSEIAALPDLDDAATHSTTNPTPVLGNCPFILSSHARSWLSPRADFIAKSTSS